MNNDTHIRGRGEEERDRDRKKGKFVNFRDGLRSCY